ncbi:MAG: hypothetical protein AAB510_01905 [Patescibacteria group bacterium]
MSIENTTPSPGTPIEKKEGILSFEEFIRRREHDYPVYGNFFLYFAGGMGKSYRKASYYIKFASEYPEMAQELQDKVKNLKKIFYNTSENLKSIEVDLYEAYVIMRGYGVSDKDLFS